MIQRYTLPEMGRIWTPENRFEKMKLVEIAVAKVQAREGVIPKKAAQDIEKKAKLNYKRILQIEKKTKHDVIAFVSQLAESVGPNGRYIHYGMTSSDALDTALSLQFQESWELLLPQMKKLDQAFIQLADKYAEVLCAGRTHGMHAEPTSFGFKISGFHAEFRRNKKRVEEALLDSFICKLSGAVGTNHMISRDLEKKVAKELNLKVESIATQVVPRDRHAQILSQFALYAAGMERLAVELRHLQRTELQEVYEGFSKGQKGSSAMPHKRNPISAENITGVSRMLRAYSGAGLENVVLWHERDISHSSVERVFLSDAFILVHYMNDRVCKLLSQLEVREDKMLENMQRSGGSLFSSGLLIALVDQGLSREDAYTLVQNLSLSLQKGETLLDKAKQSEDICSYMSFKDLDALFAGDRWKKLLRKNVKSYLSQVRKERF